jgi:hypothetical protein
MVSNSGGTSPVWRRDGKELFYLAGGRTVMSAEIGSGPLFQAGVPKALFEAQGLAFGGRAPLYANGAPRYLWDVASDGQRFLMITSPPADAISTTVNMILNWQAALNK